MSASSRGELQRDIRRVPYSAQGLSSTIVDSWLNRGACDGVWRPANSLRARFAVLSRDPDERMKPVQGTAANCPAIEGKQHGQGFFDAAGTKSTRRTS